MFSLKFFYFKKNIISLTPKLYNLKQLFFFNKDKQLVLIIKSSLNLNLLSCFKFWLYNVYKLK